MIVNEEGPVPVRLVNGNNMCSGRVEVLHNSTWGSVCGDHWGTEEANVVCRLLNCGVATSATGNANFGQGTGPVWLSDVRCNGTEAALDQCPAKPYGNNNCHHSQDASVTCSGPVPIRLTDGLNMCSGRVEVLHNSTWGSVCGDHWGTEEANVVCRLLNCGEATSATGNATFGQGTGPVWLSDVRCEGSEAALDQCPAKPYGNNNCSHSQDASVTCSGPVPVRLVNGNNMCSGRVEVLHNSTWGSVCGDHWGTEEANVVCRLLNCGNGTSAIGNATFGQGTGPVWLSDVRCEGAETALDLCPAKPYGNTTCGHSQDIGVACTGPHPMRLVDGDTMCSGRVEVFHNSVWGRVCGDDWDIADARVVCRQMSCGNAMSTGGGFSLGRGKGQTWLDKVKCSGDEKFLDQCRSQPWGHSNCVLGTDAAVVCSGPVPVRLVNGKNRCSGRVEIFHNSTWKSVCGDVWDSNAASIVCRQLMCGTILSISTLAKFGE
ncbi:deleted in malignant brain tumors 1 protein-like, partial [Callorhinchus milii]|uniref:deleted in malignant brain tumors 1 protein-like n=1 Tax=Callorhinchus milii TaxID=7868 RepID=UPI001C3FB0CC